MQEKIADYTRDEVLRTLEIKDWDQLFGYLTKNCPTERFYLAIDEFSYLIKCDKSILSTLQKYWDTALSSSNICIILSSSMIGLMSEMFLSHAWIRVLKGGEHHDIFLLDNNRPDHEPLVIVNEFKSQWSSPYEQLSGIIFHGFYGPDKRLLIISSLFFIIPIGAGSIFIVLLNRNTNALIYVVVIVVSGILVLISGLVMIENEMLRPISYIIAGGIYLRILNLIFPGGICIRKKIT